MKEIASAAGKPKRTRRKKLVKGVECDICQKRLRSKFNLALHKAVHTGEKNHVCHVCGKGFQQKWNLATHTARVHLKHKPFTCKDCGKTFGYSSHFKAHVMKMHFIDKVSAPESVKKLILHPHKCEFCSLSFENNYRLYVHQKKHAARPFSCSSCTRAFASRSLLAIHMAQRHSEFVCEVCGKRLVDPEALDLHFHTEHGQRSSRSSYVDRKKELLTCDICGKLILRESMKKHLNVHTRQRLYQCRYCAKQFLESSQRKTHERIHTGEKPYLCDVCGKGHAQYGNLMSHRKKYHNRVDRMPSLRRTKTRSEGKANPVRMKRTETICTGEETIEEFRQIANEWFKKRFKPGKGDVDKSAEKSETDSEDEVPLATLRNLGVAETRQGEGEAEEVSDMSESSIENEDFHTFAADARQSDDEMSGTEELQRLCRVGGQQESVGLLKKCEQPNVENVIMKMKEVEIHEQEEYEHNEDKIPAEPTLLDEEESRQEEVGSDEGRPQENPTTNLLLSNEAEGPSLQVLAEIIPEKETSQNDRNPQQTLQWLIFEKISTEEILQPFRKELRTIRKICSKKSKNKNVLRCLLTRLGAVLPNSTVLRRKDNGSWSWHCWTCPRSFATRSGLTRHLLIHQPQDMWPYECAVCSKRFKQSNHYKEHMLYHQQQFLYYCETCGRGFRHKTHFNRHVQSHVGHRGREVKKHACRHCEKTFSTVFHRTEHERSHTKEKPYLCRICGDQFGACSTFNRHARTHSEDKPYQCLVCAAIFKEKSSLNRHKETHLGIKAYVCECGKHFSHNQTLTKHKMVCEQSECKLQVKPYECVVCGKRFLTGHDLKRHIETHNPSRNFTCSVCNVKLKTMTTLRRHIARRHDDNKDVDAESQALRRRPRQVKLIASETKDNDFA